MMHGSWQESRWQRWRRTATLLYELGVHELQAQRRETFLGLVWMVVWPMVQAGGFLIAFNIIRGVALTDNVLITYLGVLVWSSAAISFTSSLAFLSRNVALLKYLAFPFHLIVVNDVNIRYLFFLAQMILVSGIYLAMNDGVAIWPAIGSLALFLVALYFLSLAAGWFGSLLGAAVPDMALALPAILMLLLALSPIFHRDLSALPWQLQLLNQVNPLSQIVLSLYDCIGLYGEIRPPIGLAASSIAFFAIMRFGMRRLYQEIAKVV